MHSFNGLRIHRGEDDQTVYEIVYCDFLSRKGYRYQAYCHNHNNNLIRLWYKSKTDDEVRNDFSAGRIRLVK